MKRGIVVALWVKLLTLLVALARVGTFSYRLCGDDDNSGKDPPLTDSFARTTQGREIFRFDTFGDETFFGGTLFLNLLKITQPGITQRT